MKLMKQIFFKFVDCARDWKRVTKKKDKFRAALHSFHGKKIDEPANQADMQVIFLPDGPNSAKKRVD